MSTDRDALQERIRALFVGELDEAVRTLNAEVLRLEDAVGATEGPDLVDELFRIAHNVKGAAQAAGLPAAGATAHRLEDAFAGIRDGAIPVDGDLIAQLLLHVDSLARIREELGTGTASGPEHVRAPSPPSGRDPAPTRGAVRVDAAKLDTLVDRASELLGASGQVATLARALADLGPSPRGRAGPDDLPSLVRGAARTSRLLTRLSADLANAAAALTFQSFAEACDGLERAAHDLAVAAGKQVRVDVAGGDVEIDRAVIAALREPLLHLVRNAVDHGVESPADRRAAGKPEAGAIRLAAALHEGRVEITVEDDGRGLDHTAILRAAARHGLPPGPDEELVFAPGLSTAAAVTDVSGRGVGLDAVRARLRSMGGTVGLRHRPGAGTVVTLASPVTLALLRALVVRSAGELLCLPLTAITRLVTCDPADVRDAEGAPAVLVDGTAVRVVALRVAADLPPGTPPRPGPMPLALVEDGGSTVALAVDELVGEADVVVKRPPARLAGLDAVLGTTTLPDGRAALILNLAVCVRQGLDRDDQALPAPVPEREDRPPSLLVVDDTVTTRTLEVGILEAAGYDVRAAGDGAEAWDLLQHHGADLVLTDVHMPTMDGIELCRLIRASERFGELPVVIVTSLGSDDDRRAGLEAGASAYIVKAEFDQDTLLDVIERAL